MHLSIEYLRIIEDHKETSLIKDKVTLSLSKAQGFLTRVFTESTIFDRLLCNKVTMRETFPWQDGLIVL